MVFDAEHTSTGTPEWSPPGPARPVYGVDGTPQRNDGGRWITTHHLLLAEGDARPVVVTGTRALVHLIGFTSPAWRDMVLPERLAPGAYRVVKEVDRAGSHGVCRVTIDVSG